MKIVKSLDDIIYYVAKECGESEEVVMNVHKNLWGTIRRRLRMPHQVGLGIYLPNFMRITLRETKIWTEWQKAIKYKDVPRTYEKRYFKYYEPEYYETLYYEIKRLDERFNKFRRLNPKKWKDYNPDNEVKTENK